jgi:hypothetical protein
LEKIQETPLTSRLVELVLKYGSHGEAGLKPFAHEEELKELMEVYTNDIGAMTTEKTNRLETLIKLQAKH